MLKNFLSHLANNLHSVVSKMNQCIRVRLSYDFWLHYISVFRVAHHSRYCRKFILVHYRAAFYLSVSWWRHQMETFQRYWPFVRGIHRSPVNYPHKGHWRRARETGDLRRHRAHYDVIVMYNPPIPIRMLSQNITVCLIMTFIYADTVIMLKINMRRRDFRQHDWNSSRFFVILIIHSERTMEVMDEMHDDVIKWEYLLALCEGIHRSPGDSPHKGQWRVALIISLRRTGQMVEQIFKMAVIWDAMALIVTSL